MFRPSQALLLKLKTLSIHQQLPLNARDSRQLLNILKASFRNHLDEQHWKGEVESFIKTGNEGVSNPVRRRSKSDPERQNHAERHMHSVLTSPLFNISPISKGKSHEAIRDPLETFERALALGLMNLDAANACLLAKKSQILRSSILNVQDGMRHSGAGRKVRAILRVHFANVSVADLSCFRENVHQANKLNRFSGGSYLVEMHKISAF